ncbi:MAG: lipid hydroperoxide peroxidase, partial [Bacteroidota bacterium]
IGGDGKVKHTELVAEIVDEPDYNSALAAIS